MSHTDVSVNLSSTTANSSVRDGACVDLCTKHQGIIYAPIKQANVNILRAVFDDEKNSTDVSKIRVIDSQISMSVQRLASTAKRYRGVNPALVKPVFSLATKNPYDDALFSGIWEKSPFKAENYSSPSSKFARNNASKAIASIKSDVSQYSNMSSVSHGECVPSDRTPEVMSGVSIALSGYSGNRDIKIVDTEACSSVQDSMNYIQCNTCRPQDENLIDQMKLGFDRNFIDVACPNNGTMVDSTEISVMVGLPNEQASFCHRSAFSNAICSSNTRYHSSGDMSSLLWPGSTTSRRRYSDYESMNSQSDTRNYVCDSNHSRTDTNIPNSTKLSIPFLDSIGLLTNKLDMKNSEGESILSRGINVSNFVRHINSAYPPCNKKCNESKVATCLPKEISFCELHGGQHSSRIKGLGKLNSLLHTSKPFFMAQLVSSDHSQALSKSEASSKMSLGNLEPQMGTSQPLSHLNVDCKSLASDDMAYADMSDDEKNFPANAHHKDRTDLSVIRWDTSHHGQLYRNLQEKGLILSHADNNKQSVAVDVVLHDTPFSCGDDIPCAVDVAPRTGDVAPRAGDVAPRAGDVAPHASDVAPRAGDDAPCASDNSPRAGDVAPRADDDVPRAGDDATRASDDAPCAGDDVEVVSGDNSISDVGTEYESMDGDCLYEVLDDLFVKERQEHVGKPSTEQNNKSLTGRVKRNVDRAAHYLGKIRHLRKRCKDDCYLPLTEEGQEELPDDDVTEQGDATTDSPILLSGCDDDIDVRVTAIILECDDGLKCDGEEVRDEDGLARPPVPPVPPPRSPIVDAKPAERSPPELPPCNTTASIDTILAVGGALDTSVVPLSPSSAIDGSLIATPCSNSDSCTASDDYWLLRPDDGSEDNNMYAELSVEQVYGRSDGVCNTKFKGEPLYQWYTTDMIIHGGGSSSDISSTGTSTDESASDEKLYEDVERIIRRTSVRSGCHQLDTPAHDASRRSLIMDVFGKSGLLQRALWCQMAEVQSSGVLHNMDENKRRIHESMFEILTTEASYHRSLSILFNVFLMAPEFQADMSSRSILTKRQQHLLFSNIGSIRDISSRFLSDMEACWQKSCLLDGLFTIIVEHARVNFDPYVRYCSNQTFQERTLLSLQKNAEFNEVVKRLESNRECQFLPMSSFLLLPMQRVTRLPLLVDAVLRRLEPSNERHSSAVRAFDAVSSIVKQCDEGAKMMMQTEQVCLLSSKLDFSKVKEYPLVSSSRYLIKQGTLIRLIPEGGSRIPFGRKSKESLCLFLFSDVLLVTKKRGSNWIVRDYCQRNVIHVESVESAESILKSMSPQCVVTGHHPFLLVLLSNHQGRETELTLSAKSQSERARWLEAIAPQQSDQDDEQIYEDWDCPQVQCVERYIACEHDELTLEESDIINVLKKMADGWYEGERIRDGQRGWFPEVNTEEINNAHVRARNLRLRYRLMMERKRSQTNSSP